MTGLVQLQFPMLVVDGPTEVKVGETCTFVCPGTRWFRRRWIVFGLGCGVVRDACEEIKLEGVVKIVFTSAGEWRGGMSL